MSKCSESDYGSIARVEAYPVDGISMAVPVYVRTLSVQSRDVTFSGTSLRIPFKSGTMKVTDQNADAVNGFTHTVSAEWEMTPDGEGLSLAEALQDSAHELLITYFGGARKIVRTDSTAYRFTFHEEDGTMKCSMSMVNGQGLTLLL